MMYLGQPATVPEPEAAVRLRLRNGQDVHIDCYSYYLAELTIASVPILQALAYEAGEHNSVWLSVQSAKIVRLLNTNRDRYAPPS